MLSEEDNELSTVPKRLSYINEVQAGSGQKNEFFNYSQQKCVEAPQITTIRQAHHS